MTLDADVFTLSPGLLAAIPAGAVHGFEFEEGSDGFVLMVSGDFLAVHGGGVAQPVVAVPSRADALDAAFAALLEAFGGASAGRGAALAGWALVVLSHVASGGPAARTVVTPAVRVVESYRAAVERRLADPGSVQALAKEVGVAQSTLARACMEVVGRTPLQLIHDRQMLEARRLLAYSTLSVAEVGYQLGFADPSYFSRFFLRCAGISPLDWRQRQVRP
jgi:AraC family transcriptional activator of pobA